MNNPFAMTYAALFALVANNPRVNALVRPGNFIRFDHLQNVDPRLQNTNPADKPELQLVTSSASGNLQSTSSSTSVIRRYTWLVHTGDFRLSSGNGLFAVEWALFRALVGWQSHLGKLRWPESAERGFIKSLSIGDFTEGMSDPQANRGVTGWSSLLSCEVQMIFDTKALLELG